MLNRSRSRSFLNMGGTMEIVSRSSLLHVGTFWGPIAEGEVTGEEVSKRPALV